MKKTKILRKKAKLDIGSLQSVAMIIVVVALVAAFGMQIMGDIQEDMTTNSAEYNATGDGISAVGKISDKLGTIVIVVVAAIIIGLLIAYFGTKQTR